MQVKPTKCTRKWEFDSKNQDKQYTVGTDPEGIQTVELQILTKSNYLKWTR